MLSLRRTLATSLRMTGAPVVGPVLSEGVGVVESSTDAGLAVGDRVFARGLAGRWGDGLVDADAARVWKLPPDADDARAAYLSSAVAAYKLTAEAKKGSVVLHVGGEGPVGQMVAQIAATRGVHAVSLVSARVLDPQHAVDVLKNLGAAAAAPASFARTATFRDVVRGLGPVDRVLVDVGAVDVAAVNDVLLAATKSTSAGRAAVEAAHRADVRDAKLLQSLHALANGAPLHTYNGRAGDADLLSLGASKFDLDQFLDDRSPEMAAVIEEVCGAGLSVMAEVHSDATIDRALHVANGAVHQHAFRAPLWLSAE